MHIWASVILRQQTFAYVFSTSFWVDGFLSRENLKELWTGLLYLERTNTDQYPQHSTLWKGEHFGQRFEDTLHLQAGHQAKREIPGEIAKLLDCGENQTRGYFRGGRYFWGRYPGIDVFGKRKTLLKLVRLTSFYEILSYPISLYAIRHIRLWHSLSNHYGLLRGLWHSPMTLFKK